MAIEIPAEVTICALGLTADYLHRRDDPFTIAINNSHAYFGYNPNLIIALDDLQRDKIDHPSYVDSIVDAGVPVLTTQHYEEWPTTEAYPLREVMDWLGLSDRMCMKLLNNTCNYALAYVGMMGVKRVLLRGFEMVAPDHSSIVQRQKNFLDKSKWPDWTIYYMEALIRAPGEPGLEGINFLMGLLTGRGIEIDIPANSTLLDHDRPDFFYGYDQGKQPDV